MQVTQPIRYVILAGTSALALGLVWSGVQRFDAEREAVAYASQPDPTPVTNPQPAPEKPKPGVKVHVAGAVKQPGVYALEPGSRVDDAITAAGGVLPDGLPGSLNLAEALWDGRKIYVCTTQEVANFACPTAGTSGSSGAKVNVNAATALEIEKVLALDSKVARAIVSYRTKYGPFKRVDDLKAVSGITATILKRITPLITLG